MCVASLSHGVRFARHGTGLRADLSALASQVHPVFMLPPLASSWFGSMLAGEFSLALGALHMTAVFLAVYTAHVKDGYVDFHLRGEDDDHPITEPGCRLSPPPPSPSSPASRCSGSRSTPGRRCSRSRPGSSPTTTPHSSTCIRSARRWATP
jgi:hypothetical protein